jgi:hypothetical protein
MRFYTYSAAVFAVSLGACGGARSQAQPRAPFTRSMARLFDDSVDYARDVDGLGGRVAADWHRQIAGLSRQSDVIGIARVETVVLGTDANGAQSYRLTATLTDLVRGAPPEDHRVSLQVDEGQTGFHSVAGREHRLQSGRYVVFVKWSAADGANGPRAHWHLTPLTSVLLERVRRESGADSARNGPAQIVRREDVTAVEGGP